MGGDSEPAGEVVWEERAERGRALAGKVEPSGRDQRRTIKGLPPTGRP